MDEKQSTPARQLKRYSTLESQYGASAKKSVRSLRRSTLFRSPKDQKRFKNMIISVRSAYLLELLTRPPLLSQPSMNISLPFNRRINEAPMRLPMSQRNQNMEPDPSLLSLDGLLDTLFMIEHLVKFFDQDDGSNTAMVSKTFINRISTSLEQIKTLRVGMKDFILGDVIGSGACGVVRTVKSRNTPHSIYAMKSQMKNAWIYYGDSGKQLIVERTILAQATAISNPWLPKLYYAFQDKDEVHLVMDYEPGGDMFLYLTKAGHLLDNEMIKYYLAEVIEASHSLHKMGYIHCDIKPENFAIERSGHLKLLDFGSAIRLDADGKCICPKNVGTKEYLNYELLSQRENITCHLVGPEYDYWAIGVFLYEMYYGYTPFCDEDEDVMMSNIKNFKTTLKFADSVNIPEDAKNLIQSLISMPSERLSYDEVINHPYFKDVDFSTLRDRIPIYIPDVADEGDVSKFGGGHSRQRDENITNVQSNEKTFSPTSAKAQKKLMAAGEKDDIRLLIHEAASKPTEEAVSEMEQYEWDGEECVRDLPFVGFSFTPGLVSSSSKEDRGKDITTLQDISHAANNITINKTEIFDLSQSYVGAEKLMEVSRSMMQETEEKYSNMCLQKRVKQLQSHCDFLRNELENYKQLLKQSNQQKTETKRLPEAESLAVSTLTSTLQSLTEEHSQLVKDSEEARLVKTQVDEMMCALTRLGKISKRLVSEEDLLGNMLGTYELEQEAVSGDADHSSSQAQIPQIVLSEDARLLDKVLVFVTRIVQAYSAQLDTANGTIDKCVHETKSAVETANKQIWRLNDTISSMSKEHLDADKKNKTTIERLNSKIEDLTNRLEKSEENTAKADQRYEQFAMKYYMCYENCKTLKEKRDSLEAEINSLYKQQSKTTASDSPQPSSPHSRLVNVAKNLNDLKQKQSEMEENYQKEILTYKQNIADLERDVVKYKEDNASTEMQKTVDTYKLEINELKEDIDNLRRQLSDARNNIGQMTVQKVQDTKDISQLKDQLSQMKLYNSSLDNQMVELEKKLSYYSTGPDPLELSEELSELRIKLSGTESELMTLTYKERATQKELESARYLIHELQQKIESLKIEQNEYTDKELNSLLALQSEDSITSDYKNLYLEVQDRCKNLEKELSEKIILLERTKASNMLCVRQRDAAQNDLEDVKCELDSLSEEYQALQLSYDTELHKLNKIKDQQAKLIEYMRPLIPPGRLISSTKFKASSATKSVINLGMKPENDVVQVRHNYWKSPSMFISKITGHSDNEKSNSKPLQETNAPVSILKGKTLTDISNHPIGESSDHEDSRAKRSSSKMNIRFSQDSDQQENIVPVDSDDKATKKEKSNSDHRFLMPTSIRHRFNKAATIGKTSSPPDNPSYSEDHDSEVTLDSGSPRVSLSSEPTGRLGKAMTWSKSASHIQLGRRHSGSDTVGHKSTKKKVMATLSKAFGR